MAKVAITFARTGGRTGTQDLIEIAKGAQSIAEVITSGSTSKATTTKARDSLDSAIIVARGGAVWVMTGSAPVAAVPGDGAVGSGFGLLDGQVLPLALKAGEKVAVIDWVVA